MSIPSDKQAREILFKRVTEAVQLKREQDGIRDDIKALAEACKEQWDMKPAEFNALVKAAYDEAKVLDTIETLQTSLSELDILRK